MSANFKVCPLCAQRFENEDFCPEDGILLVPEVHPETQVETQALRSDNRTEPALKTLGAGDEDAGEDEKEGFFSRIFSGLRGGRRRASTDEAPRHEEAVERGCAAAPQTDPLQPEIPPAVANQGWHFGSEPPRIGTDFDEWDCVLPGERDQMRAIFRRYRSFALTRSEVYQDCMNAAMPHAPGLLEFGSCPMRGGSSCDFELTFPLRGAPLATWFNHVQAGEERALATLQPLAVLIRSWYERGLMPLLLTPTMLYREPQGAFNLRHLGALIQLGDDADKDEVDYRMDLGISSLVHAPWAAPELQGRLAVRANAVLFSVGQILAAALWGRPVAVEDLRYGRVDFRGITDSRLAHVMMGCLLPQAETRVRLRDFLTNVAAGEGERVSLGDAWERLSPGAQATAFTLGGRAFWRADDLLREAVHPTRWAESCVRILPLLDWLAATPVAGQAALMHRYLREGRSPDWVLIRLARLAVDDLPMTWRSLDVQDATARETLINLGQGALNGDPAAAQLLPALFRADLRGAFTRD